MSSAPKKANGEGTVFQRPNGRWSGQCYVTQTDGRRVRRTVTGATKREVEKKISELIDREASGRRIAPAASDRRDVPPEWLGQVVIHRVRPNTLAAYRFQAERYLIPDLGKKRLSALSARDLRLYFESLRRRDIGARTVGYVHATLRAALEDAVREELLDRNVAKLVRVPRPEKVEREPLTVDEVKTLLRHSRDDRLLRPDRRAGASRPAAERGPRPDVDRRRPGRRDGSRCAAASSASTGS